MRCEKIKATTNDDNSAEKHDSNTNFKLRHSLIKCKIFYFYFIPLMSLFYPLYYYKINEWMWKQKDLTARRLGQLILYQPYCFNKHAK